MNELSEPIGYVMSSNLTGTLEKYFICEHLYEAVSDEDNTHVFFGKPFQPYKLSDYQGDKTNIEIKLCPDCDYAN